MRDAGHAGVEFALAATVLMIPAILMVAAFGPWSERRVLAEATAAEAARAAVINVDLASGGMAVDLAAAGNDLDRSLVRVGWCGAAPSMIGSGWCSLARGSTVSVAVEIWTPLVSTPWGPIGGVWVRGEHSEPVDAYRSLG